jgi:hypothetical protein
MTYLLLFKRLELTQEDTLKNQLFSTTETFWGQVGQSFGRQVNIEKVK